MKLKFSRRYQAALLHYLRQRPGAPLRSARRMAQEAETAGLQILDLAKLHEEILVQQVMPGLPRSRRGTLVKRAGIFFTEAITSIGKCHPGTGKASVEMNEIVEILSQRTVELAASNLELKQEIVHRKTAELALRKSERHYSELLEESDRLQKQLRQLSRKILSTQEEERRQISRELHDVIAQTLTGINVRLATLKKEAAMDTKGLDRNITRTQRLVEKSVDIVHQFARQLRPAVLDDLGLIPALHTFVKIFSKRTGIRIRLQIFAEVEQLAGDKRTILYRVAQEALTNVDRHAHADEVDVSIQKLADCICMKIKDDGKSFKVERVLYSSGSKRLGLLGMRERLEMVGGSFEIDSVAGRGTTIIACIPLDKARPGNTVKPKP